MSGIRQISGRGPKKKSSSKRPGKIVTNQDTWLLSALDEHLTGTNRPPRAGVFHPSQLGQKCDRLLYLGYNGLLKETTIPPNLARIFGVGGSLEERVDKYFTDMGIVIDRERPILCDSPPMSGRIDFIINHKEYGVMPIELKSINYNNFGKLTSEPKPEHTIQLQLYMGLGEFEVGTVLYENKNDQSLKAFLLKRDVRLFNSVIERCNNIMEMKECPVSCGGDRWCNCKSV